MATLKLDIPGLSGGDDNSQQQAPAPPPPPPPPLNFAQFASNPMAQQKVSAMIPGLPPPPPPQQVASAGPPPFTPPPAPSAPPPPPSAPPAMAPEPSAPTAQVAPAPAQAPMPMPTLQDRLSQAASPSPMQSMQDWQGANPNLQEKPVSGFMKALQIAAGVIGGGVPGGVSAGQAIHQHDLPAGLQGIDQQRYQQAVVQPYTAQLGALDTASQIQQRQGAANASNARAAILPGQLDQKTQAAKNKITQGLASKGQVGTFDDAGNLTDVADDPNSDITKKQQAQTDYFASRKELQDAQAELAKSKNNPNSPAFRQAQQRVNIAGKNAQTAAERLGLSTQEFGFNQEKFYQPQPTATERSKGDLAQSALERVQEMKGIVAKRPDIFGPVAGRAQNAQVWLGSQDPDAQTYQSAAAYLAEHSAGVFGGRGKYILESLHGLTDPHSNPAALGAALDEAQKAAQGFATAGQLHHGPVGGTAPTAPAGGDVIPPQAAAQLQEGTQHTFGNGQVWTKQNGKPVRVK